jgi:multiple sugar transport system substrate-binding protein
MALPAAQWLAACGGENTQGVISFLKAPHHDRDRQFISEYIDAFTEQQGGRVDFSYFDWGTMDADLTAAFAGDSPPDLTYLVSRAWADFADSGALLDLTDRVKDAAFKSTYEAIPVWDGITWEDKVWGVPWLGGIVMVYVNQTLLRQAGVKDWDSSYEAMFDAAAAVRGGNVFGFLIGQTMQEEAYHHLGPFIHNAGAEVVNDAGTQADLDHPGVAEAFDLLGRLHAEGIAPRPGLYDSEGKMSLFRAGRAGIAIGFGPLLRDLQEDPPDFDWDIALVPPGPVRQTAYGDYGFLCIAAASDQEKQEMAWKFINYLSSPEVVVPYSKQLGTNMPARTDVAESYEEGDKRRRLVKDFLPIIEAYPSVPGVYEALRTLTSEYEQVIRGQKSGEEAVATASDNINQLLG